MLLAATILLASALQNAFGNDYADWQVNGGNFGRTSFKAESIGAGKNSFLQLWQQTNNASFYNSLVVANGTVYVVGQEDPLGSNVLYAFDSENGTLTGKLDLKDGFSASSTLFMTLMIDSRNGFLYAFDVKWASGVSRIFSVNLATLTVVCYSDKLPYTRSASLNPVSAVNNRLSLVYFTSGDYQLIGIGSNCSAVFVANFTDLNPILAASILDDGGHDSTASFYLTHDGSLTKLDPGTGDVIWNQPINETINITEIGHLVTPVAQKLALMWSWKSKSAASVITVYLENPQQITSETAPCQSFTSDSRTSLGMSVDGSSIFVPCLGEQSVKAYDIRKGGSALRSYQCPDKLGPIWCQTQIGQPIVTNDYVFMVTNYGFVAFDKASGAYLANTEPIQFTASVAYYHQKLFLLGTGSKATVTAFDLVESPTTMSPVTVPTTTNRASTNIAKSFVSQTIVQIHFLLSLAYILY